MCSSYCLDRLVKDSFLIFVKVSAELCINLSDSNFVDFKVANIKRQWTTLWFLRQFRFQQRRRPIMQMNYSPECHGLDLISNSTKKCEPSAKTILCFEKTSWIQAKLKLLSAVNFPRPVLIMSNAAAAEPDRCCVIPPDSPIPELAASFAKLLMRSVESIIGRPGKTMNK